MQVTQSGSSAGQRRRRRRAPALLVALAVIVAAVAVGSATGAQPAYVTLQHPKTGFRITVPRAYKMGFNRGVYVMRAPGRTLAFSRTVTTVGADQYGAALLQQLGGKVVFRAGGPAEFAAQIDFGSRRDALVIIRGSGKLTMITSSSKVGNPIGLDTIRSIALGARGGVSLRPPATRGAPVKSLPMTAYRSPDGGATAQVPVGWTVDGGQGNVYGASNDGAFALGLSFNIVLPNTAPGPLPPTIVVAPFVNATTALLNVVPQIFKVGNIRIRSLLRDAALPGFTSSGLFQFDYTSNGQPWTGIALIGTDSPDKYGNISWNLYYSGIGVRVGSSPSVGLALLDTWRSWNPSGAIAARTRSQIQMLNETAQTWQQVAEFRSVTADRQSRDVGCLLQGYYVIEDNSRKYDLPPLPCGQIYTERGN